MAEYITKEQVRDIMATHYPYATLREEHAMHHINEDLKALPAADVVEVVHGEWVHDGPKFNGGVDWYHCSACLSPESGVYASRPYCSWCGAKMDGGAGNG